MWFLLLVLASVGLGLMAKSSQAASRLILAVVAGVLGLFALKYGAF